MKRVSAMATVCFILLGSCQPASELDTFALRATSGSGPITDAEEARLEDLSRIPVIRRTAGQALEEVVSATDIRNAMASNCATATAAGPFGAYCGGDPSKGCNVAICNTEKEICVVNTLLDSLRAPTATVNISGGTWEFTNLSAASRAALSNVTLRDVAMVAQYSYLGMVQPDGSTATCATTVPLFETAEQTQGQYLATAFVEGTRLLREASEERRSATLAFAEAQRSDQRQLIDGARLAALPSILSRAAAAHDLVGGDAGIRSLGRVSTEGFMPMLPPSSGERRAIEMFRLTAPPPTVLADESITPTRLIEGWADADTDGDGALDTFGGPYDSLRVRISTLWNLPAAAREPAAAFYSRLGFSERDLVSARLRLLREIAAFGRDTTITLPPLPLPTGQDAPSDLVRYAAVGTPPRSPGPVFYAAIAKASATDRRRKDFNPPRDFDPSDPATGYAPDTTTTAALVDSYTTGASRLVNYLSLALPDVDPRAQQIIALYLAAATEQRPYRVDACYRQEAEGDTAEFRVMGAAPADDFLVVYGASGLSCATRGDVEGQPCDISTYKLDATNAFSVLNAVDTALTGFQTKATLTVSLSTTLAGINRNGDQEPLLFVVRRTGESVEPGNWTAVTGFPLRRESAAGPGVWDHCVVAPVVADIEDEAGRSLEPSAESPADTAETCAGIPFDQRLPLEDELTDDGDGSESSWRHYLTLAKQAALEADALGEELVRQGLERDARAEQKLDELEGICGVAVNIGELRVGDGAGVGAACSPMNPCTSLTETCVGSVCVTDPVKIALNQTATSADNARLSACLGANATKAAVTLGTDNLCAWTGTNGRLCEPGSTTLTCPATTAGMTCPAPAGATPLYVQGLGFFRNGPGGGEGTPRVTDPPAFNPCDALRQIRLNPAGATESAVNQILNSPEFSLLTLRERARRLSWEPKPGDYSAVLVDGVARFSTGDPLTRTGPAWPCSGVEPDLCPATLGTTFPSNGPLFCKTLLGNACTVTSGLGRARRARANDMLGRAVMAARIFTGEGLRGVRFPFYPRVFAQTAQYNIPLLPLFRSPTDTQIYSGMGSFATDFRTSGDEQGVQTTDLSDWSGARAFRIDTAAPAAPCATPIQPNDGAEWSLCPWELPNCVEIFDDARDCDDPTNTYLRFDRGLPMVTREFSDASDGTDVNAYIREREDLRGILLNPQEQALWITPSLRTASQTRYYTRAGCGDEEGPDNPLCTQSTGRCYVDDAATQLGGGATCENRLGCVADWEGCIATAKSTLGIAQDETIDGNRAFIAGRGLRQADLLNGLELLCAVGETEGNTIDLTEGCGPVQPVRSVGDLNNIAGFADCIATRTEQRAARVIFRNFPAEAIRVLEQGSGEGSSAAGGDYGASVSELRAAMIELRDAQTTIASEVRLVAVDVRDARLQVENNRLSREIGGLKLASTIADRVAGCLEAVAKTPTADPGAVGANAAAAVVVCTNSAVQIGLASAISTLEDTQARNEAQRILGDLERRLIQHYQVLVTQNGKIQSSVARITDRLLRIENLQRRGRRVLSQALQLDSDPTERQFELNTVYRRRFDTTAFRYQAALRNAQRLAFLAKLAIEQRLAMKMEEMREPMTLLDEPPARWHTTVCRTTGIDYARIRNAAAPLQSQDGGVQQVDGGAAPPSDRYDDAYIGDYVRKLELVVESYRLDQPFQSGSDTSVLSLRDEVIRVRAPCDIEGPNLLYEAGHLDIQASATQGRAGWNVEGCNRALTAPDAGIPNESPCVTVTPEANTDAFGPLPLVDADYGRVPSFQVEFGTSAAAPGETQTFTTQSRLVQWRDLEAGTYQLSWYAKAVTGNIPGEARIPPAQAVRPVAPDPATGLVAPLAVGRVYSEATQNGTPNPPAGWSRYWVFFTLASPQRVGVAVLPWSGTPGAQTNRVARLAALQLEKSSDRVAVTLNNRLPDGGVQGANYAPGAFFDTQQSLSRLLRLCEDTTGELFRANHWIYECTRLCADGYGTGCSDLASRPQCYWETVLNITPQALESGTIIGPGGFAFGNYNYRLDTLALNVVGTRTRDCTDAERQGNTPTTCYGAGNISYSLIHEPPYEVRDRRGEIYDAPLFVGSIERARAVATERYVTNPISSADRALVEPYMRREFRGRPLTGTYRVRIWNDPGVRFDGIEDVQLVLNYKYWTRFR